MFGAPAQRHPARHVTPGRSGPRLGRRTSAALAVLVSLAMVAVSTPAQAAQTVLLQDTFQGSTVTSPSYVVGRGASTSADPCLTATGSAGTSAPRQCAGAFDAPGDGALRLTSAVTEQSGYLLYNNALPTKAGLDITFNQFQYGGNGADGIAFFLADGRYDLTEAGPAGGSLGYNARDMGVGGVQPGLAHALLGVGLDAFGNFPVETNDDTCAIQSVSRVTDIIAVRGPAGNVADPNGSTTGYCLLGNPTELTVAGFPAGIDNVAATSRDDAFHKVQIIVDPPVDEDGVPIAGTKVRVYWDDVLVQEVDQPAILASTPTFKFGWAASTGGSTNIHEINNLDVKSVVEILPELELTTGGVTELVADADQNASLDLTARVLSEGGPAGQPITLTTTLTGGASFAGAPTSSDVAWVCDVPLPGATETSCTYTPTSALVPGTVLPVLQVPLTSAGSGEGAVTATVRPSDNPTNGSSTVGPLTVTFRPTVSPLVGTGTASAPGTPILMGPGITVGTAPFEFTLDADAVPGPVGAPTIDATSGEVTFTPTSGASGITVFHYRATDTTNSITGEPESVTVTVRPSVTADLEIGTPYAEPADVDLSTDVLGTGPFTYAVTQPAGGAGVVTLSGPVATFAPAAGFSGTSSFTYTVTDAAGASSVARSVPITVTPSTTGLTASVDLDVVGDGSGTTGLPAPSGTGPFTYALEDGSGPVAGTATIDAATGSVSYTPARGVSGVFTVDYRATGADGVTSPAATATITVHPHAGSTVGETDAGAPVTLPAPAFAGSGTPTWSVTQPSAGEGVATIDPVTGAVSFAPAVGYSGVVSLTVVADDGGGIASAPASATITVHPTVVGDTTTLDHSASAQTTTFSVAPDGTGPWTYTITGAPTLAEGTASFAPDGTLTVTTAPGTSGILDVTYVVTGADGVSSAPATARVVVRPDSNPLALEVALGADGRGSATTVAPTPAGTGPFSYTLVAPADATRGTAVIDAQTGRVTFTAARGASGLNSVEYRVIDADGIPGPARTVAVTVHPFAGPVEGRTVVDRAVVLTAPQASGTGLTWTITQPDHGTATVDPSTGIVTYTPPAGWSGPAALTIRATDADGVPSAVQQVSVVVAPVAGTTAQARTSVVTSGTGGTPARIQLAAPSGTGPFTFRLDGTLDPRVGTATLDPATGLLTFRPAVGTSGLVTLGYTVTDASGGTNAGTATVAVVPAASAPGASAATASTAVGETLRFTLPTPAGTGPFTFSLVDGPPAAHGTLTIDAATGRATFVPAAGFQGPTTFTYAVTDADGLTSDPVTFTITVEPRAALAVTGSEVGAQLALGTIFFIVGVGLIRVVAFLRGDRD